MTSRHWLLVLSFVAAMFCVSRPAAADYRDKYCQGTEAVRRGRWAEAAQLLREAIRERNEEGGIVRCSYLNQVTYLPHYSLGRALQETGDCAGALAEWRISEAQGVIRTQRTESAALDAGKKVCEARVPKVAPEAPRVPEPPRPSLVITCPKIEPGTSPTGQPVTIAFPAPVISGGTPPVQSTCRPSSGTLFAVGSTTVSCAATDAAQQTATCQSEVVVIAARAPERPPAIERPPPPTNEVVPAPAPTVVPRAAVPSAAPPRTAPPAVLTAAVQSYFDGQYRRTLDLSTSLPSLQPSLRAQGYLFLGAARYALWQTSGGKDDTLRRGAEEAIRAGRQADVGLQPARDYFSPGFIQFFRGVP